MQTVRPRLHLHIGRNKAGSTTLQTYCLDHAQELKAAGVQYALFGYPSPPGSDVPTFSSHMRLADFVRARRAGAVLVSHEGICCFPAELAHAMAVDLSDLDTQVIFYVRPYREWIVSSYNFDVRIGFNGRDFDCYLEAMAPAISFRPILEIWGDALGWRNIRVRSTDPADLRGGDLVSDFMDAIGVDFTPRLHPRRLNTALSWMAIELMRTIPRPEQAFGWDPTGLVVSQLLCYITDEAIKSHGKKPDEAVYLTRIQANEIVNLYNRDLDFLAERTGIVLRKDDAQSAPERAFLPSAERIPKEIVRLIRDHVSSSNSPLFQPHVVNFVNQPAFKGYCEDQA